MRARATIGDVARVAGLSIKTVSRALNGEPNVRRETRDRVLQAARELSYHPNVSARRLATQRSAVIGLLYDEHESDYVLAIQDGALGACRDRGYNLLIHPCRADAPDIVEEILTLHLRATVDGVILTQPLSDDGTLTRALIEAGVAFARISQRSGPEEAPWISVDDEQAARRMTEHLIGLGHGRIGFIAGNPAHGSSHDRLSGFMAALAGHGLPEECAVVVPGQYSLSSGYASAKRLLAMNPRPTAIFASDDVMALAVLNAAYEARLEIPGDVSVCGFDDIPVARYACPPLTTVRQPIKQVARVATERLVDLLQGQPTTGERVTLESTLVLRDSTGPCPPDPVPRD